MIVEGGLFLSGLWKPVIIHSLKELIVYPHEDAQTVALWLIFRLFRPRLSFAITLSVESLLSSVSAVY